MLELPVGKSWNEPGNLGCVLVVLQAGMADGLLCFPLPCTGALPHVQ